MSTCGPCLASRARVELECFGARFWHPGTLQNGQLPISQPKGTILGKQTLFGKRLLIRVGFDDASGAEPTKVNSERCLVLTMFPVRLFQSAWLRAFQFVCLFFQGAGLFRLGFLGFPKNGQGTVSFGLGFVAGFGLWFSRVGKPPLHRASDTDVWLRFWLRIGLPRGLWRLYPINPHLAKRASAQSKLVRIH